MGQEKEGLKMKNYIYPKITKIATLILFVSMALMLSANMLMAEQMKLSLTNKWIGNNQANINDYFQKANALTAPWIRIGVTWQEIEPTYNGYITNQKLQWIREAMNTYSTIKVLLEILPYNYNSW